ncbi:hypothetical protein [Cryobacterium sp. Hb1]|uniref:hypothetical protein n=1 Tax=Cryobacterium sp. Hb1 TaxID=1259147 RepID=UPI00106CA08A|nr:hypothetical protein [Cryobacterium sp. Hb1]TFD69226.1 hypothetical protein E3T38_08565 [Cryobacterium sp. Hb1]
MRNTRGEANGRRRWPQEIDPLIELGQENLDDIELAVADLGLDCQFERTGTIELAIEEHQVQWLHEENTDENTVFLDATAVQAEVASSTYLAGVRFRHKCAGAIDTSTRFCAFFGQNRGGRISYAAGFTGLGGGAAHFAARVVLDQLAGRTRERTELAMVRGRPFSFPPSRSHPLEFRPPGGRSTAPTTTGENVIRYSRASTRGGSASTPRREVSAQQ